MQTLQVHEDDLGQISIELLENFKAYPGNFWENGLPVFSAENSRSSLKPLKISFEVVSAIASKFFSPIGRVTVGYGQTYHEYKNASAFGDVEKFAAIVEHDHGIVSEVWFLLNMPSSEQISRVAAFVADLSSFGARLIQSGSCQANCSDPEARVAQLRSRD